MKTKLILAVALSLAALGITLTLGDTQHTSAQSTDPAPTSTPAPDKVGKPLVLDEALWADIVAAEEAAFNDSYGCKIPVEGVRQMAEALAEETGMYHTFLARNLLRDSRPSNRSSGMLWLSHESRNEGGATIHYGLIRDGQQPERWRLATFQLKDFPDESAAAYALDSVELSEEQQQQLFAEDYFVDMKWYHPMHHKPNLSIDRITLGNLLDTYLYRQPKLEFIGVHGGDRELRVQSGDRTLLETLNVALTTVGGSIEGGRGRSLSQLHVTSYSSRWLCPLLSGETEPSASLGIPSVKTQAEAIAYMKRYIEERWEKFNVPVVVKLPNR